MVPITENRRAVAIEMCMQLKNDLTCMKRPEHISLCPSSFGAGIRFTHATVIFP